MEKHLESKLRDQVKAKGGLSLKFVSPGTKGPPDRINLFPEGKLHFVEMKFGKNGLSPQQVFVQKLLRSFGFTVVNIKNEEELKQYITSL